jgi:D-glycero-D-manno-heptose 1,7-bisphosphate phosphatase
MQTERSGQRAVFVDRDGTLIRDVGHLCRADQVEILPRVPEALQLLKAGGFKVVMVTNQSVVARGRLTEPVLGEIHRQLLQRLARQGGDVDAVYYCPHHPTEGLGAYRRACECRKPNPGMVHRAAAELGLAVFRSYVVGDQLTDMELAARSGATGVWIQPGGGAPRGDAPGVAHVVEDLWGAARWIVGADESPGARPGSGAGLPAGPGPAVGGRGPDRMAR